MVLLALSLGPDTKRSLSTADAETQFFSVSEFVPKFTILSAAQRQIWPHFEALAASGFVLYGGTALALRLGHRASVDFDFFSAQPLDRNELSRRLLFLDNAQTIQDEPNTLTVLALSGDETVKISFFADLNIGRVAEPEYTEDHVCQVASLLDLYGTKLKVILQRVEVKDYRDIVALIQSGLSLGRGLGAARAIFGKQFQAAEAIKALTYFEGGDLNTATPSERSILISAASEVQHIEAMRRLSHGLTV